MSKGARASQEAGRRAENGMTPIASLTDRLFGLLCPCGDAEINGVGPGWLRLEWKGQSYDVEIKPSPDGPRILATLDERPVSDQFPVIPEVDTDYSARLLLTRPDLLVMDCEGCATTPPTFSVGDDEVHYTLDFRRPEPGREHADPDD